jgi:uncharacterized membrane protein
METPTTVKHHPLHPILITLPIGMFVLSLIADIIYLGFSGNPIWPQFSVYAIIAGIISALVAAVPGMIDWFSLRGDKVQRTANYHAVLNLIVLALFGGSLAWRLNGAATLIGPFIVSLVGILVLGVGGWLGGTLVHEYHVAVDDHGTEQRA